jgi:hypothetical protein
MILRGLDILIGPETTNLYATLVSPEYGGLFVYPGLGSNPSIGLAFFNRDQGSVGTRCVPGHG